MAMFEGTIELEMLSWLDSQPPLDKEGEDRIASNVRSVIRTLPVSGKMSPTPLEQNALGWLLLLLRARGCEFVEYHSPTGGK